MAWSDSTNTPQVYGSNTAQGAQWDAGTSQWDAFGNIVLSYWDLPAKAGYTETTNNTQTWTDQ